MFAELSALVDTAIAARAMPGMVVLAEVAGVRVAEAAIGTTQYDDEGTRPLQRDDLFDLASLTKLFTATAVLRLHAAGSFPLDRPLRQILPQLHSTTVTARHLLCHTSGYNLQLSALRELPPATMRAMLLAQEHQRSPGSYQAYANVNSALLALAVEALYGGPFSAALDELVIAPLGLRETRFNPPAAWRTRIVPTEIESWRGLVHGVVHDESTYALGGIAGHAGLFGPADDLLRFAAPWCCEGGLGKQQFLPPAIVAEALRDHTSHLPSMLGSPQAAGLGWMLNRPAFMGNAPAGTAGHTGFTGATIIVAPQQQAVLITLCNRTYPQRTPPPYRHHPYTAAIADLLWQQLR